MTRKTIFLAGGAITFACLIAGLRMSRRQNPGQTALTPARLGQDNDRGGVRVEPSASEVIAPPVSVVEKVTPPPERNPVQENKTEPGAKKAIVQPPKPPPGVQGGPPPKPPIRDPDARDALALVGADPQAEAYWLGAINDPNLPSEERKDLIEDLNEDGLSDPKHPGPDDLPIIPSRILLLEEIGANPMDQINAEAFKEAYKDLVNLAGVAAGGGEPVK